MRAIYSLSLISCFLFTGLMLHAQNPQWVNYTSGKEANCSAPEGDVLWIGTDGGLVSLNRLTGIKTFYNKSSSGLPDNRITCIAIDIQGTKWMGTNRGLISFDGTTWAVYDTLNSDLPSNSVNSIAIDLPGNKWIGTHNGLVKFSGMNWVVYDSANSELPVDDIQCVAIDSQGITWIGTGYPDECTLCRFDGINWTIYDALNSQLPGTEISCIVFDAQDNKWIGTWNGGLTCFDGINWTVYNPITSGLLGNTVTSIAIDQQGNKWIGESGYWLNDQYTEGCLTFFDGTNWTNYTHINSEMLNVEVNFIDIDTHGYKWLGTEGCGLIKFSGSTWTTYNLSNSGLFSNNIACIAIDNQGTKWIGSNHYYGHDNSYNGLVSLCGSTWTSYDNLTSGIPNKMVSCITIDAQNNKWIGTLGGGLVKFNGTTSTIYNTVNSEIFCDAINCIAIDNNGYKWIGHPLYTNNQGEELGWGLSCFDGTTWAYYDTLNSGLPGNSINCIAIDSQNNKWIGTDNGLAKFDGTIWTVYNTVTSQLPDNYINCIAIDTQDVIWIGTYDLDIYDQDFSGLVSFDGLNWTEYNPLNSILSRYCILSIFIDNQGVKWIGSDGLYRFDGTNWTVYNVENSGLPSDGIYCIAIDSFNNKWMGTSGWWEVGGLAVFNENGIVAIEDEIVKPYVDYSLINFPNPFKHMTRISYNLEKTDQIQLSIYNIKGQLVKNLSNGVQFKGLHLIVWDGTDIYNLRTASGIYFCRIKTKDGINNIKLIHLK